MGVPTAGGESFYWHFCCFRLRGGGGGQPVMVGWACPPRRVTFDPSHVLPWAWQEVKGETVEADYHVPLLESAGSRAERKAAREWVLLCGGCVSTPMQEMRSAVVWAMLYSGLDECGACMWMLYVGKLRDGLWASGGLPVAN